MHGGRDGAADVVEVDVHAARTRRLQLVTKGLVLVVDRDVVAVQPAVGALVRAARDADGPAAGKLRDLPDDLSESGRGIPIIKALVDVVEYGREADANRWYISRSLVR